MNGNPREIAISIVDNDTLDLAIYYESLGMIITYHLVNQNNVVDAEGNIYLCNKPETIFRLRLWLEAETFKPTDFWDDYSLNIADRIQERRRLRQNVEVIMGVSVDEFVQQFKIEGNCIRSQ